MIKCSFYLVPDGRLPRQVGTDDIGNLLATAKGLLWVDIQDKVLSIVAAIFLPLTLLAGIYGMDFVNMPELQWRYGYFVLLGVMALLATFLVIHFKRRKWL